LAAGVSSVLVYQETYDPETYRRYHLSGPKADMPYRLETPDRLGRAGIKKIGLGALYGLADWRAESWFVAFQLRYLERQYWKTRYSISFPRLRPHEGVAGTVTPFDERDLVQAACAFRLFSPEVELSLSTRESQAFRDRAFRLGFTAMSAGSKTNPGGYASCCAAVRDFDVRDNLSSISVPTLVIAGAHDFATPAADGRFLAENIPGAQYVELRAAHLSNIEAAAQFTSVVENFLSA